MDDVTTMEIGNRQIATDEISSNTGPRGSQGAAVKIGSKGDKGDRAVEIDIVAELCKPLLIAIVEQYRRGAYARYAINSMEDVELHDAARAKTIIDKGGRCNTSQTDVTRMATLSQTGVNIFNFHNDAYNMEADIYDFHYLCVFLVYRIKAQTEHWERNYLISNWRGGKETNYRGICFLPDKKTLRIHGGGSVGSDMIYNKKKLYSTAVLKELKKSVILYIIYRRGGGGVNARGARGRGRCVVARCGGRMHLYGCVGRVWTCIAYFG